MLHQWSHLPCLFYLPVKNVSSARDFQQQPKSIQDRCQLICTNFPSSGNFSIYCEYHSVHYLYLHWLEHDLKDSEPNILEDTEDAGALVR